MVRGAGFCTSRLSYTAKNSPTLETNFWSNGSSPTVLRYICIYWKSTSITSILKARSLVGDDPSPYLKHGGSQNQHWKKGWTSRVYII